MTKIFILFLILMFPLNAVAGSVCDQKRPPAAIAHEFAAPPCHNDSNHDKALTDRPCLNNCIFCFAHLYMPVAEISFMQEMFLTDTGFVAFSVSEYLPDPLYRPPISI